MKITLDIDQLRNEGRITPEEYDRLKGFAGEGTMSLALNILLALGIVAVAGGTIALSESSWVAIVLGLLLAVLGGYVCRTEKKWNLLGGIVLPLGALTATGGIISAMHGSMEGFVLVAALLLGGGMVARSGLLVSLSVFAMLSALGGLTEYDHAAYYLCIEKPFLTVVVFSVLATAGYVVSHFASAGYARLATIFAHTAVVVVNFGFWVGSLWGEGVGEATLPGSEWFFIVGWFVALLAAGVWGVWRGQRWMVNTVATFGAIHFYTQWFEHFSATPGSVIVAGLMIIAMASGLIIYNRRAKKQVVA